MFLTFLSYVFQIVKVLNLYTPVNEFEERVSVAFIRTIQVISFLAKSSLYCFIFSVLGSFFFLVPGKLQLSEAGSARVIFLLKGSSSSKRSLVENCLIVWVLSLIL